MEEQLQNYIYGAPAQIGMIASNQGLLSAPHRSPPPHVYSSPALGAQLRLECLKLAWSPKLQLHEIVDLAEQLFTYVAQGEKPKPPVAGEPAVDRAMTRSIPDQWANYGR
jgi:hypothetical protein